MYSRTNVVDRLTLRLKVDSLEDIDTIKDLCVMAEDFISMDTHLELENFPSPLESMVVQMVLELWNQRKSEGYQNETVEGVTIRYQNTFQKYVPVLRRYRKLRTV